MELLVDELNDQIKSALSFHVRQFLSEDLPLEHLSSKESYLKKIENDEIEVTEEFLESFRKKGPVSRDYVYQYTEQVTKRIIQLWKEYTEKMLVYLADESRDSINQTLKNLDVPVDHEDRIDDITRQILKRSSDLHSQIETVEDTLKVLKIPTDYYRLIDEIRKRTIEVQATSERIMITPSDECADPVKQNQNEHNETFKDIDDSEIETLIKQADRVSAFSDDPLLHDERDRFLFQADKLKHQEYVISLFGAFSAGKSSFANALIGVDLLPVSPQPATASRTTITKPTEKHGHGTILVQFKTMSEIEMELSELSQILGIRLTTDVLSKWGPGELDRYGTISKSATDYLDALRQGLYEMKSHVGDQLTASAEDLYTYAAKESVSSMVDHIIVYYDSDLTKQGITLVDTPGVNSIHSRHTKTALKQINHSDAIFFLTYYNHAFSKADQYFIEQLGETETRNRG